MPHQFLNDHINDRKDFGDKQVNNACGKPQAPDAVCHNLPTMDKATVDIVTFWIALLGAGLGIFNAWRSYANHRVNVRVTPSWGHFPDGTKYLEVTVVNLSAFAVTVTSIGYEVTKKRYPQAFEGKLLDGTLPKRLESRTSLTFQPSPTIHNQPHMAIVTAVYADTACGLHLRKTNAMLRAMAMGAKAAIR